MPESIGGSVPRGDPPEAAGEAPRGRLVIERCDPRAEGVWARVAYAVLRLQPDGSRRCLLEVDMLDVADLYQEAHQLLWPPKPPRDRGPADGEEGGADER